MNKGDFTDDTSLASIAAYSGDPWTPDNLYFQVAEKDGRWLWENLIWPFINDSDFTATLDLAAGHGRNSAFLLEHAGRLTITDIHAGNIETCRRRFGNLANIEYAVVNGHNFRPVEDESLTLIYCFDSMVHFDRCDLIFATPCEF